jgi:acyl-CoA synthetase (AMP-forming)/AMP-acid ligase II
MSTGAAFLAVDPTLPGTRQDLMTERSNATFLVEADSVASGTVEGSAIGVAVPRTGADAVFSADTAGAAYVTSTSGSTGEPKAIVTEHEAVSNCFDYLQTIHGLGPDDVVLQMAPVTSDACVRDLLGSLAAGATVVFRDDAATTSWDDVRAYKCGKAKCRCKGKPPQLHGLYAFWTRKVDGKTVTRMLSDEKLAEYQPLFDNARKVRALVSDLQELTLGLVESQDNGKARRWSPSH